MATFKFGRYIDIHWNGYDIQGPADTVFSIPDQLYEEFDADIAPVEPTLQWIDTNEFQTLQNSVPNYTIAATSPIAIGSSTATSGAVTKTWSLDASYATSTHLHSGVYQSAGTYVNAIIGSSPASVATASGTATVSISSGTNPNGYLLTADGSGGVIFTPASTSGLTSVVGISPISSIITGGTVSVSLNANYQTAGTYVSSVIGSAPVSASGTTAITVSIDQTALSVSNADTATTLRTYVKNSSGSTITKGQAVYITGADGTNALIGLASATSDAASSKTLGIAANTMTNNAFGYVIENGQLSNIDTSATTAGAAIWLGNTPGSLVFGAPPAEPSHAVYLGVVTKANVSTGEILVKVQNGYELDELHDVFVGGVSTALPLVYSSTSSGWIAQALSSVGIADNAVVEAKINAGAVTSAKIADNAVVSAKILDGAVTSAKIADNAVVAAKINAGAVNTAKIDSGLAALNAVLTANGTGGASFLPVSGAVSVSTFTASGTWTKPTGTSAAYVMVVGAGGGGASKESGSGVSNGGSGGLVTTRIFAAADISSASYSVTIGAGGTGGASAANGNDGGQTSFGSLLVALGGKGGSKNAANADGTPVFQLGAVVISLSTTTAVNISNGTLVNAGQSRIVSNTDQVPNYYGPAAGGNSASTGGGKAGGAGFGRTSALGGGGAGGGTVAGAAGSNATGFGDGGGGGSSTTTPGAGGNGFRGGGGGSGGYATTSAAGGTGGDGYCIIVSW